MALRRPGIEPGSQEWESCMIPLHQRRSHGRMVRFNISDEPQLECQGIQHLACSAGSQPTFNVQTLLPG